MLSRFSCVPLFDTMDCSPPGSSVHGILQARILEWVAISFSSAKKAEVAKLWLWELDGEPTLFIFLTPWRGVCQLKVIGRSWGQLLFQMDTWADAAGRCPGPKSGERHGWAGSDLQNCLPPSPSVTAGQAQSETTKTLCCPQKACNLLCLVIKPK